MESTAKTLKPLTPRSYCDEDIDLSKRLPFLRQPNQKAKEKENRDDF